MPKAMARVQASQKWGLTRALRQAKASYSRKMFQAVKKMSAYWNLLNKATNSTTRKCIGPLKWDDGSLALADDEKACLMNLYFAMIGKKLAKELQSISKSSRPYNLNTERQRQNHLRLRDSQFLNTQFKPKLMHLISTSLQDLTIFHRSC